MVTVRRRRGPRLIAVGASIALLGLTWQPAAGAESGAGRGLEPVALVPFDGATHIQLATIKGREYAFVANAGRSGARGSVRVVDVTSPEHPRVVAQLDCGTYQGHLQLSHDKRTLILGLDSPAVSGSCMPVGEMGFVTIDVSDPRRPRAVGYAVNPNGSHSTAAHPSQPYVYNGEGFPDTPGRVQVWSIENPAEPELVTTLDTGEHSAHDLSFNRDGSLAAFASVTSIKLVDTSDPANPSIVFTTQCPGCMHTHEARFTPDGKRLIVNDEWVSSVTPCPGAVLYFYAVSSAPTGAPSLTLTGVYTPGDVVVNANQEAGFCTAHVFDISRDGTRLAAAWHTDGVHYLDISGTTGATFGAHASTPGGASELGWYVPEGADTFSAKLHKGPYVYTTDTARGFEIFKVTSPSP